MNEHKFKIGCVCIDVFSKYAVVVPIQTKNGDSIASGILDWFKLMGKQPEILYTDDEAAISAYAMIEYYEEKHVRHYVTRNHAAFAERFIGTFKDMLCKRIDGGSREKPQWHDYIYEIMLT